MASTIQLRRTTPQDHSILRQVYVDAIESIGEVFYSKEQIRAWSALAFLPGILDKPFSEGQGWLSLDQKEVVAFGLRYPSDRLALLYCRGRFARLGHASTLLNRIEFDAKQESQSSLSTEASFFSYPLFIKSGWRLKEKESIQIAGIGFKRFLMMKKL